MTAHGNHPKMLIGWREWISLPDFCVPAIKAKVDTGAATSSIHAFDIEPFEAGGERFVRFCIHPIQDDDDISLPCRARLLDKRKVKNSGGESQSRYVIGTTLEVAGRRWGIELNLTNRDEMSFRMLIGRQAMRGHLMVDPQLSFQTGKMDVNKLYMEKQDQ